MKCHSKTIESLRIADSIAQHLEAEGVSGPMACYSMLILIGVLIKLSGQQDIPTELVERTIALGYNLKADRHEVH